MLSFVFNDLIPNIPQHGNLSGDLPLIQVHSKTWKIGRLAINLNHYRELTTNERREEPNTQQFGACIHTFQLGAVSGEWERSLVCGRGKHTRHDSGEPNCDSWPRLTVSRALPVRRGTRRLHLASINLLLLPWNNVEELPQSCGSDTDIPVKPGAIKLEKLCSCVNSISPEGLPLSGQLKRSGVEKNVQIRLYIHIKRFFFFSSRRNSPHANVHLQ